MPLFIIPARRKYLLLVFPLALLLLIFVWTGEYYVSFLIDVLLARYQSRWDIRLGRWIRLAKFSLLAAGLLLYQGFDTGLWALDLSYAGYKYGWVVTAIGCALILLAVFSSRTLQRWLSHGPFVFPGKISYSVYLLQFIIILCLLPPLLALFNHWENAHLPLLFLGTILAGVILTVGCAAIMYFLVETPVINFGRWLTKKIQRRYQK